MEEITKIEYYDTFGEASKDFFMQLKGNTKRLWIVETTEENTESKYYCIVNDEQLPTALSIKHSIHVMWAEPIK